MPKAILDAAQAVEVPPDLETLLMRVPVAMGLGFVVAGVYHLALGRRSSTAAIRTTLVLLCILVAIVTIVIGNNLARAFGLVGALSIVRFRTVVADTRDTAFVIFSVVVGMAAGTGYLILTTVAIPAILIASLVMTLFDGRQSGVPATLTLKLPLTIKPEEVIAALFAKYGITGEVCGAGSAKQGAAVELKYRIRMPSSNTIAPFVTELQGMDGVQGVELKANGDD